MGHISLPSPLLHLNKNFLSECEWSRGCFSAPINQLYQSQWQYETDTCLKSLENGKTLADSGLHAGDLTGEVITMHVVVQPSVTKQKTGKSQAEKQDQHSCSCTIL